MRDKSVGGILKVRFLHIVFFTLLGALLKADEPLTLAQALSEAMDKNPSIRAAASRVEAARAPVAPSFIWPNPALEVMWMNLPAGSIDPAQAQMRQYSVSQMVPFPAKTTLMGLAMAAERDMVRTKAHSDISSFLAEVEHAYWMLYMLKQDRVILEESRALLEQLLSSARSRYAKDLAPQAEVLRAELERSEVEVKIASTSERITAARIELALLLGRDSSDLPLLPQDIPLEITSDPELPSYDSAPKVKEARSIKRVAQRRLAGAWLELAPDFMVSYRWREMEAEPGTGDVMVALTLPLWVWPRGSATVASASARRKAAVFDAQAMANEVRSMAANHLAMLRSSAAEIERTRSEVLPLAVQALASARLAYQTGAVDFPMLLDAENEWREARMELEEARFDYQKALADLKALLGGYEIAKE